MLSYDPRLVTAARYCNTFGLDVVDVLRTDTEENRRVRLAALRVISRDNEEEMAKSKRK